MIYILIQSFNRLEKLKRLLDNPLFIQDARGEGAVVVINAQGCTDGTNEYVRTFAQGDIHLKTDVWISWQNPGVVGGRCRLLDYVLARLHRHDILVYLDDDVEVAARGWLEALIRPIRDDSKIAITGAFGVLVQPGWSDYVQGVPALPCRVDVVSQSHTADAAHLFLDGVEFDLGLGFVWHEDTVLCMEAHARGYEVFYVGTPESIGLKHDPHRKDRDAYDGLYWKNWERIKERYAFRGLVMFERALREIEKHE